MRLVRPIFALAALLFVWAAYLQVNDTEPALWIAIYAAAATLCGLGAARIRLPPLVGFAAAVAAVVGAAYLGWLIYGLEAATAMYGDGPGAEAGLVATKEGREMFGLLIIAAASAGYGYWSGT